MYFAEYSKNLKKNVDYGSYLNRNIDVKLQMKRLFLTLSQNSSGKNMQEILLPNVYLLVHKGVMD